MAEWFGKVIHVSEDNINLEVILELDSYSIPGAPDKVVSEAPPLPRVGDRYHLAADSRPVPEGPF